MRRAPGERLVDDCVMPHHGNRVQGVSVWGAIHFYGKSQLVFMDVNLNQFGYMDIIRNNLLPFARATYQHNFVLVQDNATPHSAHRTQRLLATEQVEVMGWPPMSPDMNPIEHVWDYIGRQIQLSDAPPTTLPQLRQAIQQAWDGMPQGVLENLIDSMPRRRVALVATMGGYTRY